MSEIKDKMKCSNKQHTNLESSNTNKIKPIKKLINRYKKHNEGYTNTDININ